MNDWYSRSMLTIIAVSLAVLATGQLQIPFRQPMQQTQWSVASPGRSRFETSAARLTCGFGPSMTTSRSRLLKRSVSRARLRHDRFMCSG